MDLSRFLDLVRNYGWQGAALLGVLLAQAALWVELFRLHLTIKRENAPWDECVGKIRSAQLRRMGGAEETETLKGHSFAPIADGMIALHLAKGTQRGRGGEAETSKGSGGNEIFVRWLLLRSKIQEGLRPYWIRWGHQVIGFGVLVWLLYGLQIDIGAENLSRTPCDPRLLWVWLGCSMVVAWRLVRLQGDLERVQRALLAPEMDE
jgi:hypothetical protein